MIVPCKRLVPVFTMNGVTFEPCGFDIVVSVESDEVDITSQECDCELTPEECDFIVETAIRRYEREEYAPLFG